MVSVDPPTIGVAISPDVKEENARKESGFKSGREASFLFGTFLTTAGVFGIFFVQGVLLARVLGPEGRGEFGSAVLFAQQLLLYVGLLGGIDIVNQYAKKRDIDGTSLKYSAVTLGILTGCLTAVIAATLSVLVFGLFEIQKAYLIPFCLLTCLFVPFEHIHLIVSGVDRGTSIGRYNKNRLLFASVFPICLLAIYLTGALELGSSNTLLLVCMLFVLARIIGLLPTLRGLKFSQWLKHDSKSKAVPAAKQLVREGVPYAWSMLATELFERLDVLLIVLLAPVKEAGFYFVAVPAAALLTIGPNALSVLTFNAGANDRPIAFQKSITIVFLTAAFQLFSLAVLWFLIPQLIVNIYGSNFEPSIRFVWYLLPACAIKGFLQPLDGFLRGSGKPYIGVWSRITSIVVMLGFAWFAYPSMGLYSIPLAACVGQAISMLIITSFAVRELAHRSRRSEAVT